MLGKNKRNLENELPGVRASPRRVFHTGGVRPHWLGGPPSIHLATWVILGILDFWAARPARGTKAPSQRRLQDAFAIYWRPAQPGEPKPHHTDVCRMLLFFTAALGSPGRAGPRPSTMCTGGGRAGPKSRISRISRITEEKSRSPKLKSRIPPRKSRIDLARPPFDPGSAPR